MRIYGATLDIDSTEKAITLVEEILGEIRPWPEKIQVLDRAEFRPRLISSKARAAEEGYTLTTAQRAKMGAIRDAVKYEIRALDVGPRIPNLLLVEASSGAVAMIWDSKIYQAIAGD